MAALHRDTHTLASATLTYRDERPGILPFEPGQARTRHTAHAHAPRSWTGAPPVAADLRVHACAASAARLSLPPAPLLCGCCFALAAGTPECHAGSAAAAHGAHGGAAAERGAGGCQHAACAAAPVCFVRQMEETLQGYVRGRGADSFRIFGTRRAISALTSATLPIRSAADVDALRLGAHPPGAPVVTVIPQFASMLWGAPCSAALAPCMCHTYSVVLVRVRHAECTRHCRAGCVRVHMHARMHAHTCFTCTRGGWGLGCEPWRT